MGGGGVAAVLRAEAENSSWVVVVVAAAKEIDTVVTRTDGRVPYTASFRIVFHATVGAGQKKKKKKKKKRNKLKEGRRRNAINKCYGHVSFSLAMTISMSEDRCVFRCEKRRRRGRLIERH